MKISAVLQNTFKRNFATNRNVDLTSFGGENNRSQTSSMTDKNANEALKNNGMSHVSFTGITQNWYLKSVPLGGTSGTNYYLTLEDGDKEHSKDVGNSRYVYSVADSQLIKQEHDFWAIISEHSHRQSNSLMVRTSNPYITKRIYFADPEEAVSAQTKKDHDFVVYDTRPVYPTHQDVRDLYLNPEKRAFSLMNIFKNVGEYYYRLELADKKEHNKLIQERKAFQDEYDRSREYKEMIDSRQADRPWSSTTINRDKEKADYFFSLNQSKMENYNQKIGYYQDRINFSRVQQRKASEGYNISKDTNDLINERDEIRSKIENGEWYIAHYKKQIEQRHEDIEFNNNEIDNANSKKTQSKKEIDAINTYKQYQETNYGLDEKQKKQMEKDIERLEYRISSANDEIKKRKGLLANCNQDIKESQEKIAEYTNKIAELRVKLNSLSEQIVQHYPKMAEFYQNNIEEWQCS